MQRSQINGSKGCLTVELTRVTQSATAEDPGLKPSRFVFTFQTQTLCPSLIFSLWPTLATIDCLKDTVPFTPNATNNTNTIKFSSLI